MFLFKCIEIKSGTHRYFSFLNLKANMPVYIGVKYTHESTWTISATRKSSGFDSKCLIFQSSDNAIDKSTWKMYTVATAFVC